MLRDLKDLYEFEPGQQDWAARMAGLLIEARNAARDARAAGKKPLDLDVLGDLVDRYQAIATSGLAVSVYRQTETAKDARRIARRFLRHGAACGQRFAPLRIYSPPALIRDENGTELITLTAGEVRRLFKLHAHITRPRSHHERWSRWRRRHQAIAQRCHYQRRFTENHGLLL